MKISIAILAMCLVSGMAFAGDDSCDDYISRHERADLAPAGILLGITAASDISPSQQKVELALKNVGNLPIGISRQTAQATCKQRQQANPEYICTDLEGTTAFEINLNGKMVKAGYEYQILPGQTTTVTVLQPLNTFRPCQKINVKIDTDRKAGQRGCDVYANDSATLTAYAERIAHSCRGPIDEDSIGE